jgi:formimidoylglutamate deiminase
MTTLFAPTALLPEGWSDNVLIEIDKDGWIVGVDTFKKQPEHGEGAEIVAGPLIPGMPNAHSHAFQRAMAGMAERAGGRKGTFWGWRETMYRFMSFIEPEDMEPIAAQVFIEMLKAGYTSVAEFHYLHHQQDGSAYADPAIMSRQVIRAALETGIAITHMPALYAFGGPGGQPPTEAQKRFLNTVPSLVGIIDDLHGEYKSAPQVTLGFAHHSLRAVSPDMMREGTKAVRALLPDAPIHILAAAQTQEVEAVTAWSGKRPVAWLLENANVDENWCFVHATNIDEAETKALAASGVVAALCPTTEANTGGGIFPLADYFSAGGAFAVGSGSHVSVSLTEELRWLEYEQRLLRRERTVLASHDIPSTGATLFERCLAGGARALGRKTGRIEAGHRADFVVLDSELPSMTGKVRDHILDAAVFAAGKNPVRDVMSGGRWAVKNRHHKREEQVLENFRKVMRKIT